MIVDTSAIMAILLDEQEQEPFVRAMMLAPSRSISAGNWIELSVVLTRRKSPDLISRLDQLLAITPVEIIAVDGGQARIGAEAYRRYGHGSGHVADLNFGDCFAYALAKSTGEPLLFKGDDFIHTDITPAR
ncbi:MAG: VapC toxin family PIN domain ribonuclease [Alphaproteobacteria bacterium HGW-Alphaproteobacteria-16]|nr:MAG: VapC toxin family PIN domain ribonuclease [Alphaproteobacteria bacterium HGW-Alphaproteobacteria-16]